MQLPATLCRDCRFHIAPEGKFAPALCGNDAAIKIDFVNGNHHRFTAQSMRMFQCGPDAKFFEPATQPVPVKVPDDVVVQLRNGSQS